MSESWLSAHSWTQGGATSAIFCKAADVEGSEQVPPHQNSSDLRQLRSTPRSEVGQDWSHMRLLMRGFRFCCGAHRAGPADRLGTGLGGGGRSADKDPNGPRFGLRAALGRPPPPTSDPESAKLAGHWSNPALTRPNPPNTCRCRSRIGRVRLMSVEIRQEVGPELVEIASESASFAHDGPNLCARIGHHRPNQFRVCRRRDCSLWAGLRRWALHGDARPSWTSIGGISCVWPWSSACLAC